jgi:hypothetical protein
MLTSASRVPACPWKIQLAPIHEARLKLCGSPALKSAPFIFRKVTLAPGTLALSLASASLTQWGGDVDAGATHAIGLNQADQEFALPASDVNHADGRREAQETDEPREFLLTRGVAHDVFTVSDVVEVPGVHSLVSSAQRQP